MPDLNLIVVVDDDPKIQDMIYQTLTLSGYTVLVAGNGIEALGIMTLYRPGAILLDINMPYMDGVLFVQELELCHARTCPIIVLTAAHDEKAQARITSIRAEAVLRKPFHLSDMLITLEQTISRSHNMTVSIADQL